MFALAKTHSGTLKLFIGWGGAGTGLARGGDVRDVDSSPSPRRRPVWKCGEHAFQCLNESREGNAQSGTEGAQFHDIEAALAAFAFADEGLCFIELGGQLDLAEAATLAGGPQFAQENPVVVRGDAFIHTAPNGANIKSGNE